MQHPYFYNKAKRLAVVKAGNITLKIPHNPKTASQSPFLIKRANNMGFMLTHLDPVATAFIEFCKKEKPERVVDLDCSYGISTVFALQQNIRQIIATDNHSLHHQILKDSIPDVYAQNLICLLGNFPEDVLFDESSIDGFHSSRMLHFYTEDKIEKILIAVLKALKCKGKFFVSTDTPYWGIWDKTGFLYEFEEKKKRGEPWPGFMEDIEVYTREAKNTAPTSMNFLDEETARNLFIKMGFEIKENFYITRDTYPRSLHLDGREGLGIIAVKP